MSDSDNTVGKTYNCRLKRNKRRPKLLTDPECQSTHITVATPGLVDAAIGEVVDVPNWGQ